MLSTATKTIEESALSTICPAPITPPTSVAPLALSRLVTRCSMWYLAFSLPSVELWSCKSCTWRGSSWIRADVCAATGGTAAATNPPASAASPKTTADTAAQRGRPRRMSQAATGSRPAAMKNASPIRISTERALISSSTRPYVTATPAAAFIPMRKGERWFRALPGLPSPPACRSASAASTAPRIGWSGLTSSASGEAGGTRAASSAASSAASFRAPAAPDDAASPPMSPPTRPPLPGKHPYMRLYAPRLPRMRTKRPACRPAGRASGGRGAAGGGQGGRRAGRPAGRAAGGQGGRRGGGGAGGGGGGGAGGRGGGGAGGRGRRGGAGGRRAAGSR